MTDERVIIVHGDGRSYSVTREAHARLYKAEGFTIEGPENDDSFAVAGVPAPKAPRRQPKAKARSKPKAAAPIASPAPAEDEKTA
jgi:hypothetical protein